MINVNFQPMNVKPSPEIPNLPEVLLIMNAEVCLLCTVWNVRGLEDTLDIGCWT